MNRFKVLTSLLLLLVVATLQAEPSDEDKVYILTDYLVKEKSGDIDARLSGFKPSSSEYKALSQQKEKMTIEARNEAVATVYGKPYFTELTYDDRSEMFFGRIVSENGNYEKDINFYMPKQRARAFKKNLEEGRIEIEHVFDDNEIVFKEIELNYAGVNYPLHVNTPNSLTIKLGGYFVGVQDTNLQVTKNGIGGTLGLQELFDMEPELAVGRIDAAYRFNPKHRIEASWYSLNSSGEKAIAHAFEFDGETIEAGASVGFYFDTDIYKVNYVYSAYRTNKLELTFRVGLHITSIDTGLSAKLNVGEISESRQTDSLSVTAPLPVAGLGLNYEIIPDLNIDFHIDYFAISYDSAVSGSMSDSVLTLDYMFNQYFGLGGGFNRTQMRFKGRSEETEIKFTDDVAGLMGYVIFSY